MTSPSFYACSKANCQIVGTSSATGQLVQLSERLARSSAPVLLYGPVGCEFEKVAAFIHHSSSRASHPFARQRCVHWQDSMDPLRTVGAGTLFVEGIQHASLPVQLRLLTELDEARLSSQQADGAIPVPPRIIASANEDLFSLVENGMLLEDLHWQLCALSLRVPGLAERSEDIPLIAQHMLDRAELMRGDVTQFRLSESSCVLLQSYSWPGNYRQLQSVLQRAVALAGDSVELEISQADLDDCAVHWQSQRWHHRLAENVAMDSAEVAVSSVDQTHATSPSGIKNTSSTPTESITPAALGKSFDMQQLVQAVVDKGIVEAERAHRESHSFVVDRVEKALIASVLAQCGNVQKAAAQKLGMNRNTLHKKIKEYGLE